MVPSRPVTTPYPTPPLVEAIFEFFIEPPAAWSAESEARLTAAYSSRFPGPRDEVASFGVELRLGPEGPSIRQGAPPEPRRLRLWTEDKGELVQFGAAMCAYNLLSHYTRFEDHIDRLEEVVATYLAEVRPTHIEWTGQRYLNRVVVPASEGGPQRYFEVYPRFPTAVHGPFALQVVAGAFENGQTVLGLTFQGERDGAAAYTLDLYARSTLPVEPSPSALRQWHEKAHESVRQTFEAVLTPAAKAEFAKEGR